ncbi:hypothetical protein BG000_002731, partial [Podila horticola]
MRSRSSTCRIAPAGVNVPGVAGVVADGLRELAEASSELDDGIDGIDVDVDEMSREEWVVDAIGWFEAPLLFSFNALLSVPLGSEARNVGAGLADGGVDRWNEPRFKRRTQAWFENTVSAFQRAST